MTHTPTSTAKTHVCAQPLNPTKTRRANKEVVRWGEALLEADTDRIGEVGAVGIDETLFWRKGRWRTKVWCTSVVDVGGHQPVRHSPW